MLPAKSDAQVAVRGVVLHQGAEDGLFLML